MSWKQNFVDRIGEHMRFLGYSLLLFDLIVLSGFSLWFICNFVYRLSGWLNRIMFDKPW
jgi:hypothetical protein